MDFITTSGHWELLLSIIINSCNQLQYNFPTKRVACFRKGLGYRNVYISSIYMALNAVCSHIYNVFCCSISGNKISMKGHVLGVFLLAPADDSELWLLYKSREWIKMFEFE